MSMDRIGATRRSSLFVDSVWLREHSPEWECFRVQHRAGQAKECILSDHGLTQPHSKRTTCGTCKHPSMRDTREHEKGNPLPQQRNTTTNNQ